MGKAMANHPTNSAKRVVLCDQFLRMIATLSNEEYDYEEEGAQSSSTLSLAVQRGNAASILGTLPHRNALGVFALCIFYFYIIPCKLN